MKKTDQAAPKAGRNQRSEFWGRFSVGIEGLTPGYVFDDFGYPPVACACEPGFRVRGGGGQGYDVEILLKLGAGGSGILVTNTKFSDGDKFHSF
jgi:hypothetical protein